MVYTPFLDGLHTVFRWFAHQPYEILWQAQLLIGHYPQRNTLFNTKYLTLSDRLWISAELKLAELLRRCPKDGGRGDSASMHSGGG